MCLWSNFVLENAWEFVRKVVFFFSLLQNRMWRKNRSPQKGTSCIGVDLNRNFDANWCSKFRKIKIPLMFYKCKRKKKNASFIQCDHLFHLATGASPDPCTEIYCGPFPESEPESQAVANFLRSHKESIQIYLSIHSYSQMLIIPYSCTEDEAENHSELVWLIYFGWNIKFPKSWNHMDFLSFFFIVRDGQNCCR